MDNLFKNFWEKAKCQKNGICSINPVLNALDALIINELRQIAFYIVRLSDLNFHNEAIMHYAIETLSLSVSDTSYNENSVIVLFNNLSSMKEKVRDFYKQKSSEMNIPFEFVNFPSQTNYKNNSITELIKAGEEVIKLFYNNTREEKSRLVNLAVISCKTSALNLVKLSSYKKPDKSYYFEILRLLSLTNYAGTREEKFIRRIKEFSNIAFKLQEELIGAYEEKYGKRETGIIDTSIYQGKSILVSGGDLDELYNLLEKASGVNIYYSPSNILAASYPVFKNFPNLKGLWGTGDAEFDFANFKGVIYLTKNSSMSLDTAFRGKIFTTKLIPSDRAIPIKTDNLCPLIECAKETEGFFDTVLNKKINFEYDIEKIKNFIETNRDKKILISIGGDAKLQDYAVLKFEYPNEIQGLFYALSLSYKENTAVYFESCTQEIIGTIIALLNKNLHKIYLKSCQTQTVSPHITSALQKDFNIQIL